MKKLLILIACASSISFAGNKDIDLLNETIAHLREVKMELEEENFELKASVDKDKKAVDSLTKAMVPLKTEVDALKKANQAQQADVAKAQSLQQEVTLLKAQNEQTKQTATAQLKQKDALIQQEQTTNAALKKQILALQTENGALQGGASSGKNDIAQLKVQVMQLTSERDQLKAQLQQAQRQAATVQTQVVATPVAAVVAQPAATRSTTNTVKPFSKSDIQVQLVKKQLEDKTTMRIVFNFKNNSQHTVTKMTAQVKLVQNSRFLMNVDVEMDDIINAGEIKGWSGKESFDSNHPGHQMLLSASPNDVTMFVNIKSITFADGSTLY